MRTMDKDIVKELLYEHSSISKDKTLQRHELCEVLKRKAEPDSHLDQTKKPTLENRARNGFRKYDEIGMEEDEMSLRDQLLEQTQSSPESSQSLQKLDVESRDLQMQLIVQQKKKVIKMKRCPPNLALPEGWIAINHRSGGILYLHRSSRVVTWSRPYHIGTDSVRKHDVPVAAIPCLDQLKGIQLEKEKQKLGDLKNLERKDITACEKSNNENLSFKGGATILNMLNTMGTANEDDENNKNNPSDVFCEQLNTDYPEREECGNAKSEFHGSKSITNSEKALFNSGLDVVLRVEGSFSADDSATNCFTAAVDDNDCKTLTEADQNVCDKSDVCCNVLNKNESSEDIGRISKEKNSVIHDSPVTSSQIVNHTHWNHSHRNIKTQNSFQGLELIDYEELERYLSLRWEFEELTREQEQNIVAPSNENDQQLAPVLDSLPYSIKGVDLSKTPGKDCYLNPEGKTPAALLHEYSHKVLKTKPEYLCYEGENSSAPFVAEVLIDGVTYGREQASSKKQAKHMAAEATLEILVPGLLNKIRDHQISRDTLQYFDKLKIEDPEVNEMCIRAGLPTPYSILKECLKRNQGLSPDDIASNITPGTSQNHIFKMTCGKHTVTANCKNKKSGKQLAAQKLLQKLYPRLENWGSLLRIYCDKPTIKCYKKEKEDQQLDVSGISSGANADLLSKLRQEMKKLSEAKKQENLTEERSEAFAFGDLITVDV